MVHGRERECAAIDGLLASARDGRSGVLVLRGEAGIGKTALVGYAADRAGGMRVLRAQGVESESELAFASLQLLLRGLEHLVERLPEPQAIALRGALGLALARSDDRFLIALAVLGVLAEAAEEGPVLVLVDDAHWLDDPSDGALGVAIRRLDAEGVAVLVATRAADDARPDPRVPSLTLGPLAGDAAAAVLRDHAEGVVAPEVAERLLANAGGHPLALAELPVNLSAAQLAGREPLPSELPLGPGLERALLDRVARLPTAARAVLVLAAADDGGDVGAVLAAAERLELAPDGLDAAERAGLVTTADGRLQFRHPLVRSAVYRAAGHAERRRAHATLAQVAGAAQPERQVWHRAAAASGPDEEVAAALETSADSVRSRGGHGAAAAALERAAALSVDDGARARRLVAAADAAWIAGHGASALALLERASVVQLDAITAADAARVRGTIELHTGEPPLGARLLIEAADAVQLHDSERALDLRLLAVEAGSFAGALQGASAAGQDLSALLRDEATPRERFLGELLYGLDDLSQARTREAAERLRRAASLGEGMDDARLVRLAGVAAVYCGDEVRARRCFERSVAMARAAGALGTLPFHLHLLGVAQLWAGAYDAAELTAGEGIEVAQATGRENAVALHHALLCRVAALRGRQEACRDHADQAISRAVPHSLHFAAATANLGLAELDLSLGRSEDALDRFQRLVAGSAGGASGYEGYRLLATPLLVEAAAGSGAADRVAGALALFAAWAGDTGSGWALPLAERCRALAATDSASVDAHFAEALRLHDAHPRPLDAARTALLYGEHLRRERRKVEARVQLRNALHAFEGGGAPIWAERARQELRATGETTRGRDAAAALDLTPQELRIARLVATGSSNRDVAAQLFVSPKTVEYHLAKVFQKLGLTSRAQLATVQLQQP